MAKYTFELNKLEKYLIRNGIPYVRKDEEGLFFHHQLIVGTETDDGSSGDFDVVCSYGSYGSEEGLLEAMNRAEEITSNFDDVEGYLTANDIIRKMAATGGYGNGEKRSLLNQRTHRSGTFGGYASPASEV